MQSSIGSNSVRLPHTSPGPSFSTLPLEIKRLIVEMVAEGRYDGAVLAESARETPTMRSLSLVNRELAALVQPHLWQVMYIRQPLDGLVHFVDTILPRHGHHINFMAVEQTSDAESLLVARTIASSPKLAKFFYVMDFFPGEAHYEINKLTPNLLFDILDRCRARDVISLALIAIGDRLEDLTLLGVCGRDFREREVASFLSHFPSLSRLTITCPIEADSTMPGHLISTLASLRHLHSLDLRLSLFDPKVFASAAWICPMKDLRLDSYPCFSIPEITTLLAHFSTTLTSLDLTAFPGAWRNMDGMPDPVLRYPPLPLPHLHTLDLETNYPAPFLASFSLCPLRYLTINKCPYIDSYAWIAFISSHADTLRRVTLGETAWPSSLEALGLGWHCETIGCEFESEISPSEGEESDEEVASRTDGDEDAKDRRGRSG